MSYEDSELDILKSFALNHHVWKQVCAVHAVEMSTVREKAWWTVLEH